MTDRLDVRRLGADDAASFIALRREALEAAPLAFAASPEDDFALAPDFVGRSLENRDEQAVFGYFEDGQLRGSVGLVRSSRLKQHHLATLWGMYVSSAARRRGAGRALIDAAVAQARAWSVEQVQLGVTDAAPEAKRLYESAGFRTWGRQPRTLQWRGRFVDESHMALDLRAPGGH